MDWNTCFAPSYREARARFVEALRPAGFRHERYPIGQVGPTGEPLSVDVGVRRSLGAGRAIVVSSGLGGVEGYLGSAVQLALLHDATWLATAGEVTVVLVHALNPYGFAWGRRVNEDNVDLASSFFAEGAMRPATPEHYARAAGWLAPERAPRRVDPVWAHLGAARWSAAWRAHRAGDGAQEALAHGGAAVEDLMTSAQYEHPTGLFFGGHRASATQAVLDEQLASWVRPAEDVLHLDLRMGVRQIGGPALIRPSGGDLSPPRLVELSRRFGAGRICRADQTPGELGAWAQSLLPGVSYTFATAVFGAQRAVNLVRALRAENQAHHWGAPLADHFWAKRALREAFAPSSPTWRAKALGEGLAICRRAMEAAPSVSFSSTGGPASIERAAA